MNQQVISPPQDRVLLLPESKFVNVVRVRVSLRCRNCGNQYGVSFSNDTLRLPLGWDVCNACSQRQNDNDNSNMVVKVEQGEHNERTNTE